MPQNPPPLPDFTRWPSFPFEGDMRVKHLAEPVAVEPPRSGEDASDCVACNTPDDAYIWVSERWRVRGMDRPTGLPIVLILECRSHLDIGDLPNLLAAELGVMTVRLERAIRSLDGVARVHVNRWGDGSAHLHMWFLARPYGRLQLRGTFLSLWDDILPVIDEEQWLENLALVAEWLAGFGGRAIAEPPHIHWQSPSTFGNDTTSATDTIAFTAAVDSAFVAESESASDRVAGASLNHSGAANGTDAESGSSADTLATRSDLTEVNAETRDLSSYVSQPSSTTPSAAGDTTAVSESRGSGESGRNDQQSGESAELSDGGSRYEGTGSGDGGRLEGDIEPGEHGEVERGANPVEDDSHEVKGGGPSGSEVDAEHQDSAEPGELGELEGGAMPVEGDRHEGSAKPADLGEPEVGAELQESAEFEDSTEPGEHGERERGVMSGHGDSHEGGAELTEGDSHEGGAELTEGDSREGSAKPRDHSGPEVGADLEDSTDTHATEQRNGSDQSESRAIVLPANNDSPDIPAGNGAAAAERVISTHHRPDAAPTAQPR